jgi:hypothetical protein
MTSSSYRVQNSDIENESNIIPKMLIETPRRMANEG